MIAKNYIKHPEALRFQREMFGHGHTGHYPRIMRLMEVIFNWKPDTPNWVKEAKTRAAQLVKAWKHCQLEMFATMKKKARNTWTKLALVLFPDAPEQTTETAAKRVLPECPQGFRPFLTVDRGLLRCAGNYLIFCNKCHTWATFSSAQGGEYKGDDSYFSLH